MLMTSTVKAIRLPEVPVGTLTGVGVAKGVTVGNGVAVNSAVVRVAVGVRNGPPEGVIVGVEVTVGVLVGVGVDVTVGVLVGVGVESATVTVGVAVGVGVESATVTVGVAVGVGVESATVTVGVGVGVRTCASTPPAMPQDTKTPIAIDARFMNIDFPFDESVGFPAPTLPLSFRRAPATARNGSVSIGFRRRKINEQRMPRRFARLRFQ